MPPTDLHLLAQTLSRQTLEIRSTETNEMAYYLTRGWRCWMCYSLYSSLSLLYCKMPIESSRFLPFGGRRHVVDACSISVYRIRSFTWHNLLWRPASRLQVGFIMLLQIILDQFLSSQANAVHFWAISSWPATSKTSTSHFHHPVCCRACP